MVIMRLKGKLRFLTSYDEIAKAPLGSNVMLKNNNGYVAPEIEILIFKRVSDAISCL